MSEELDKNWEDQESDVHVEKPVTKTYDTDSLQTSDIKIEDVNGKDVSKLFSPSKKPLNMNILWLNLIKKNVPGVTYAAFETYKNDEFLKIIRKNEIGGKDTIRYKLVIPSNRMSAIEWNYLYESLKNKSYDDKGSISEVSGDQ